MVQITGTSAPQAGSGGRVPLGPPGRFLLGNAIDFQRDPLGFVTSLGRDYGAVARVRFGGLKIFVISHPDGARRVLQENYRNYNKDVLAFATLRQIVGNGLFTSDGEFWLRQRRLMQPAFHRSRVEALGEIMTRRALALAKDWDGVADTGKPVYVATEMMHLTLDVVNQALFSTGIDEDMDLVSRSISTLVEDVAFRTQAPFYPPLGVPTPRNRRFRAAVRTLDHVVYRIIDERRRRPEDRGDFLSLLLDVRDESTGERMSDLQLRDEVITFYLAGHETTAVALSWVWYLLSTHPGVAQELRAELDRVLAGRPPSVSDLPNLPYTRMVIEEAMRLYPPVWITSRKALADDDVCGFHIPTGSMVSITPYGIHHNAAIWENPEGFDPERFRPERPHGLPNFAYLPFGAGPRQCIGRGFAMQEAHLILATLAQRFRLDLVPGYRARALPYATLRPSEGLPMTVHHI